MPIPLLFWGLGALLPAAFVASGAREKKRVVSPAMQANRDAIYDAAIHTRGLSADKLRGLSVVFRKEGLEAQAEMLEKRAALAEASPEEKATRTAAFRAALTSKNSVEVLGVASGFEALGATGAAARLRTYAKALESGPESAL